MAERFPDFQVEEIQELKENSENQNTKKSTSTWLNVWTSWAESKNFETNLLSYEAKQLDETLQKFFAEIRKKDGSEYEPDSLRVMLASLDRHLREKDAAFSIAKDIEFSNSRKVLEGKARLLRQEGFGKRPNAAKALTSSRRRIVVVQRSAWKLFSTVTHTDHVVLAHPALWFEELSGAPRHVR